MLLEFISFGYGQLIIRLSGPGCQICSGVNARVHHVETPDDLDPEWFVGATSVGVTAGASTPDEQMQAVIRAIEAMA